MAAATSFSHQCVGIVEMLQQFRLMGKKGDVTIYVGDASFQGHRAVLAGTSEYFRRLFLGRFDESEDDSITLSEFDASIFEQVLDFMYTGDAKVSSATVFTLLRAADFYQIPAMEEWLMGSFQDLLPIPDACEALEFATLTQRTPLVGLLSKNMVERFEQYSGDEAFRELSKDAMKALLSQRWFFSCLKNEDHFSSAAFGWLSRNQVPEELHQQAVEELGLFTSTNDSTNDCETPAYIPTPTMYAYTADQDEVCTNCFATDRRTPRWELSGVFENYWCDPDRTALAALNDWLYCVDGRQFRVYETANIEPRAPNVFKTLRYLPITGLEVQLVPVGRDVYAYTPQDCSGRLRPPQFTRQQLDLGMCAYNTEVGSWFPLPDFKRKLFDSSLTAYEDIVYYAAAVGDDATGDGVIVQAYDGRTPRWQDLGGSGRLSRRNISGLVSSAIEDAIYVCGKHPSRSKGPEFAKFDLRAGRWATHVPLMPEPCNVMHQLVPYEGLLWTFGLCGTPMNVYNAVTNEWWNSLVDGDYGVFYDEGTQEEVADHFIGAVVFR